MITNPVLQYEAVECGAACLKIVLDYCGRVLPLAELRQRCGISRDGVTAIQLKQVALELGLEVRAFRCSPQHLQEHGRFPCILFWDGNHFLVLEGFGRGQAALNDPACGRRCVALGAFERQFSGVVLELQPGAAFATGGSEPGLFHALPALLAPYRSAWPWLAAIALMTALPEVFIAGTLISLIDGVLQNGRLAIAIPLVWITALATLLLTLALNLQKLALRSLGSHLLKRLSSLLSISLYSLPHRFVLQRLQGELAQRLLLPLALVQVGIHGVIDMLLSLAAAVLALLVGLWIAPWLALLTLGLSAGVSGLTLWIRGRRRSDDLAVAMAQARTLGTGLQLLQRSEAIKASGLDADAYGQWADCFNTSLEAEQQQAWVNALLGVVGSSASFVLRCGVILIGGLLILQGQLSLGELVGFLCLVTVIELPLQRLNLMSSQLQLLDGLLGRLNDVIDTTIDPLVRCFQLSSPTPAEAEPTTPQRQLQGELTLDKLGFRFSHTTAYLFEDLNLQLRPGQHLAIVGGSGSGKSTLLRLLAGLETPSQGEIHYDGRPWLGWDDATLRRSIALVAQDGFLFQGSVEENLTLWDPRYSSSAVLRALEQMGLLDELDGAEALELVVGEGGRRLSGGQRQRLEIARALLRQPRLLLLDEATSALDEQRERSVMATLKATAPTLVSVAHRLYTAQISDWVVVLDGGRAVQQGPPEALAACAGPYRQLLEAERLTSA